MVTDYTNAERTNLDKKFITSDDIQLIQESHDDDKIPIFQLEILTDSTTTNTEISQSPSSTRQTVRTTY